MLAFSTNDFGEFLAALLGHGRHGDANHVTLRRRVQSKVRIPNRLFDLGTHAFFPRRNADSARIEQRHVRHLADGHHRAVIVHMHGVEQTGIGATCADFGQAVLERIQGLLHFLRCLLLDLNNAHGRIS